jgi:hypothetical protein
VPRRATPLRRIVIGCGAAIRASRFGPAQSLSQVEMSPRSHQSAAGRDIKRLPEIANPTGVDTEVVSDIRHRTR